MKSIFIYSLFLFSLSIILVQTEDITYPPNFLGSLRTERHVFQHYEDNNENMELFSASASLIASPSTIENGGSVHVEWKGISGAATDDWIAIFCGEPGSDSNYLDYLYTNTDRESGSVWFQGLVNLRCDYYFRYYHGSTVNHFSFFLSFFYFLRFILSNLIVNQLLLTSILLFIIFAFF